ncbi:hypothetical protein GCM10010275_06560 [Streptomyces litmocidini]|nr:hypothetical protein GCM10010275_06560 [Streptomyces litmocidini]
MSGQGGVPTGGARWNDETQSWESGGTESPPAPAWDGGAPGPVVPEGAGPVVPEGAGAEGPGSAAGPVVPEGVAGPVAPGGAAGPVAPGGAVGPGAPVWPPAPQTAGGPGTAWPVAPPPPPPPEYAPEYGPGHLPGPPGHAPDTGGAGGRQYPAPPVPAPRARSRAVLAAGAALAVLAAGSVGAWLVWGRSENGAGPAAGPPASVSAAPETGGPTSGAPTETPSESPSGTSTPLDEVPPPGYRAQEDLKGFTIAVPEGWNRTESEQGVFYNAPDGRSLIQVFVIQEAGITPYEALRGASEDGRTNKPGYAEIGLRRVTGEPGVPADSAELVYAYDREGGRRKVVDRAFTAEDGNQYAILAAGPDADWPKQRERLRVALDFFRPGAY